MSCIVCSDSLTEYAPTSSLSLPVYYCKQCDFYTTGSSRDEVRAKLIETYQDAKWIGYDEFKGMLKSNYTNADSLGKKRQLTSQIAYCKELLENKNTFFEVGSGAGQTICRFEEMGFSVIGIEPDKNSVEMVNKRLKNGRCMTGFAEDLSIDEKFDIIWVSHVLEHTLYPDILLDKFKKNLNPDGIIFIEVPNCENKKILQHSIKEPSTFHFSKQVLEKMAKIIGYKVVKSDYFRSPTLFEGALNKISKYPFYPKISTNNKKGTDIRIILKMENTVVND